MVESVRACEIRDVVIALIAQRVIEHSHTATEFYDWDRKDPGILLVVYEFSPMTSQVRERNEERRII